MAKKTQNIEADETDLANELDDVAIKVDVTTVGGGGMLIPKVLANVLKRKFEMDGSYAAEKTWFEGKLGYDVDTPMKGRPNAVKKKLNRQYADLAGDGNIWHVGNSHDTHYLISILAVTPEEEDKWKNPKPKPKKEEEVED